ARCVVDGELGCLHRIVTCPTVGGHASRRRARCVRDAWTPFRCAVRALWKKDLRPDERLARVVIPRRCHRRRNGRTERQSTRSFGEYAFLEDSRYASQPKNISGRIRRGRTEEPRGRGVWCAAGGRGARPPASSCDAII